MFLIYFFIFILKYMQFSSPQVILIEVGPMTNELRQISKNNFHWNCKFYSRYISFKIDLGSLQIDFGCLQWNYIILSWFRITTFIIKINEVLFNILILVKSVLIQTTTTSTTSVTTPPPQKKNKIHKKMI